MPDAVDDAAAVASPHSSSVPRDRFAAGGASVHDRAAMARVFGWVVPVILGAIVVLALLLRVAASRSENPLGRELLSLLGAQTVAERVIPLLPSGVLYLHGTVYSFLLAPFVALGFGAPADIHLLRLVSAVASTFTVVLTFRLARYAQASAAAALVAAAFVAIDPASVFWGGYVRMYALAQPLSVAVALLFLRTISDAPANAFPSIARSRTLFALVLAFWLAVFTHLATALLWPAMAATAVIVYGKDLLRERRDLAFALVVCFLAPVVLVALTGAIGPGAGTAISGRSEGLPLVSFLGEDNVNLAQILEPDPSPWTTLFAGGPLALLAPFLFAIASGLLIGRFLTKSTPSDTTGQSRSVGALLALYWVPILALSMFATNASERYAVFLLPTGYVILALAADVLIGPSWRGRGVPWSALGGTALIVVLFIHGAVASANLETSQAVDEPQSVLAAEAFVEAHRKPGELVLTTSSVDSALTMGQLPELRYLPGGEDSQRSLRYTRVTADGQPIDYWIGMPSLNTTRALCTTLQESPGSWVLFINRIWDTWGYNDLPARQMERQAEELQQLILGLADQAYEDGDNVVFQSRPANAWSRDARAVCRGEDAAPQRENRQNPWKGDPEGYSADRDNP